MPRYTESSRRKGDGGSGKDGKDSNFFKHMGKEVKDRFGETKMRELEEREILLHSRLSTLRDHAYSCCNDEVSKIRRWVNDSYHAEVQGVRQQASDERQTLAKNLVKEVVHRDVYISYQVALRRCNSEKDRIDLAYTYISSTRDAYALSRLTSDLQGITDWEGEQVDQCSARMAARNAFGQQQELAAQQQLTSDLDASTYDFNRYLNARGDAITPFNIRDTEALLNSYENSTNQRFTAWNVLQQAQARRRYDHDHPSLPAYGQ